MGVGVSAWQWGFVCGAAVVVAALLAWIGWLWWVSRRDGGLAFGDGD